MAYDSATLDSDLQALEARLVPGGGEESDLKKALTDVAKGKGAKLSKARDDMGEDDEDEEDEDGPRTEDDDTEDWIQNLLQNKGGQPAQKSRGWDEPPARRDGLYKALNADSDVGAVDVGGYLQDELQIRERDRKELRRLRKTCDVLLKGMADIHKLVKSGAGTQERVNGLLSKGLLRLLDQAEDFHSQPVGGSRFALMEKSASAAREHMRASGGQQVQYNKEHAFRLLQKGMISNAQHHTWKTTGYLPPGIDAA